MRRFRARTKKANIVAQEAQTLAKAVNVRDKRRAADKEALIRKIIVKVLIPHMVVKTVQTCVFYKFSDWQPQTMAHIQRRRNQGRNYGVEASERAGECVHPAEHGIRGLRTGRAGAGPQPPRRPSKF